MKTLRFILLAGCMLVANFTFSQKSDDVNPADSTGLAGDHFSLEGALELFKTATSPEDFEKKLNTEENNVNNLDLDGNSEIDYILVLDRMEGTSHVLVLQVSVSETESQDIAVIEIEKDGNESALLQIVGDEELYGDSVFVEPFDEKEIQQGSGKGQGPDAEAEYRIVRVVVNVWGWPCVRYVYAPGYVVWASPWKWRHYPVWWKPWRPHPWRWHRHHCYRYRASYRVVHTHRVVVAHRIYRPHRVSSALVRNRYQAAHVHHKARKAHVNQPRKSNVKQGKNARAGKQGRPAQQKPVNKRRR